MSEPAGNGSAPTSGADAGVPAAAGGDPADRKVAFVALGSCGFALASFVLAALANPSRLDEKRQVAKLISIDNDATLIVAGAVTAAITLALLGLVVRRLGGAVAARSGAFPRVATTLAVLGPVLFVVAWPGYWLVLVENAGSFANSADHSAEAAKAVFDKRPIQITIGLVFAAELAVAFAMVMLSTYAMRADLLSRFGGIIGVIIGIALVMAGPFGPTLLLIAVWTAMTGRMLLSPAADRPVGWTGAEPATR